LPAAVILPARKVVALSNEKICRIGCAGSMQGKLLAKTAGGGVTSRRRGTICRLRQLVYKKDIGPARRATSSASWADVISNTGIQLFGMASDGQTT
jgi:hypothetical protein